MQTSRDLLAVCVGQRDIGEEQLNLPEIFLSHAKRLGSVLGRQDAVPGGTKDFFAQRAQSWIVLHHQNRPSGFHHGFSSHAGSSYSVLRRRTASSTHKTHRSTPAKLELNTRRERLWPLLLVQYRAHFVTQRVGREWLLQKICIGLQDAVPHHRIVGITAHK